MLACCCHARTLVLSFLSPPLQSRAANYYDDDDYYYYFFFLKAVEATGCFQDLAGYTGSKDRSTSAGARGSSSQPPAYGISKDKLVNPYQTGHAQGNCNVKYNGFY